ncbi:hypothetical protein ACLOJK_024595 [Asimina triloba]
MASARAEAGGRVIGKGGWAMADGRHSGQPATETGGRMRTDGRQASGHRQRLQVSVGSVVAVSGGRRQAVQPWLQATGSSKNRQPDGP